MGLRIKNKYFKIDWKTILPIVFFILLILYTSIDYYNSKEKWENPNLEKRYTIGVITGYVKAGKSPDSYEYSFDFEGKKYKSSHLIVSNLSKLSIQNRKKIIGKHYYVKFIVEDPGESKLLMSLNVPDTISIAPENGWKSLNFGNH